MLVRLLISIWKDSTCKAQKPCDLYLSFSSLSQAPHPLQGTYYRAGSSTLYTFSLLLFSSCLCFFCFSVLADFFSALTPRGRLLPSVKASEGVGLEADSAFPDTDTAAQADAEATAASETAVVSEATGL
jgi:hypothetical protein